MGTLDGRVAVVTGAGGGIGREHALALAAAGAGVVVNDLGVDLDGGGGSTAPALAVVAEIEAAGGKAVANGDSVAAYDSAASIIATALEAFGRVDILVNNASVFRDGPFQTLTPDDFAADLSVHLFGTFNMCKHALPLMVEQGHGRIVSTTSSAFHSASGLGAYAAAKAGIVGLSFDLAAEYWRHGITVNVLSPSAATEHRIVDGARWMERLVAAGITPPSPPATDGPALPEPPDHVPPIVVFLVSDDGAAISGKIFEASGNMVGIYGHPTVVASVHKDPDAGRWTHEELVRVVPSLMAASPRPPHIGA